MTSRFINNILGLTGQTSAANPVVPASHDSSSWAFEMKPRDGVVYNFASAEEFSKAHVSGSTVELKNELIGVRAFNEMGKDWKCFVVAPLSMTSYPRDVEKEWLVLTDPTDALSSTPIALFPRHGDKVRIGFCQSFTIDGQTLDPGWLNAERIENPFVGMMDKDSLGKLAAFRISMRNYCNRNGQEINLLASLELATSLVDIDSIELDKSKAVQVSMRRDEIITSFLAEVNAVGWLSKEIDNANGVGGPSKKSLEAFEWLIDFSGEPSSYVNLFEVMPHLYKPDRNFNIPRAIRNRFGSMNSDHLAAFENLDHIPAGIFMIAGCPGSGKAHWNITVAALAMWPRPGIERGKVLYLIDVNKPIDDVADCVAKLMHEAGIRRIVIRMSGWPREFRNCDPFDTLAEDMAAGKTITDKYANSGTGDFTPQFLMQAQLAMSRVTPRDRTRAMSLDEAAWELFDNRRGNRYALLGDLLEKCLENEDRDASDLRRLRVQVFGLYRDVLRWADFVATTPVAAWGEFSEMFTPDLVFIDEASHARELTSLIPIAFFSPKAWIYTGDCRQTRPFVADAANLNPSLTSGPMVLPDMVHRSIAQAEDAAGVHRTSTMYNNNKYRMHENKHALQLTTSTMERAEVVGRVENCLTINHRAYGNLEKLASKLYYESRMVSGFTQEQNKYPPSTRYLQTWLQSYKDGATLPENRILLQSEDSCEKFQSNSFWNPANQEMVMKMVREILDDDRFQEAGTTSRSWSGVPGTVMIVSPYRAATRNYMREVKKMPKSLGNRVDVRTVDTAQGHEADVVFVDMVRTTTAGFMDDAHRLNVAITRARQAEIIFMSPEMTFKKQSKGGWVTTKYLKEFWDECTQLDREFE